MLERFGVDQLAKPCGTGDRCSSTAALRATVNHHLARASERLTLVQHRLDLAFQHDSVVQGIGLVEALAVRRALAADRGGARE